jgi:hypothetical protein
MLSAKAGEVHHAARTIITTAIRTILIFMSLVIVKSHFPRLQMRPHYVSQKTSIFGANPFLSICHSARISHVFSFAYSQCFVRPGSLTLTMQPFSCLAQASAKQ